MSEQTPMRGGPKEQAGTRVDRAYESVRGVIVPRTSNRSVTPET
ncbi:MAG: hypothetical protein ACR2FX_11235 [Chthoniobacterales bacterium]